MKDLRLIKGKLPLLLVLAISLLCVGFFIVSCGKSPQQKAAETDQNSCAIDLSSNSCHGSNCSAPVNGSTENPLPRLASGEATIEAWVQRQGATTSTTGGGGIFSRYDGRGISLYIRNNIPKFGMGRAQIVASDPSGTAPSLATSTGSRCFKSNDTNATSTECYVSGINALVTNAWTHIAGVLVNEDHSTGANAHADCTDANSTGANALTPHLDIYVNGVYVDCATTTSDGTGRFPSDPGNEKAIIGNSTTSSVSIDSISGALVGEPLDYAIDEVRFWSTARTGAQIAACMNTELGIGGTCNSTDPNLAAYYRLNDCEGASASDFSLNGIFGTFEEIGGHHEWETGWFIRTDAQTPTRAD